MASNFKLNTKELDKFIKKLNKVGNKGFNKELKLWLEAMGFEFLDIIQDEIIRSKTVDTRRLLNSFNKGEGENIWSITHGGLTLEVGTNLEYAVYVNDGHWTVNEDTRGAMTLKDGTLARWVPGTWRGSKFTYDKNARTGMLLKRKWIDGTGYWESAMKIFERIFHRSLERNLQEFLNKF